MKISVVIPTYNSAAVIRPTLDSVLRQTNAPDEILVLDDGSKDETVQILRSYGERITVLQQQNQGVAAARNVLSEKAAGDLIAFLDHDDLWHPRYLEVQRRQFEDFPDAVAFFTGHVNFNDNENVQWPAEAVSHPAASQVIQPLKFLQCYNEATGMFGSMSFCCVPKRVLTEMGNEPFRVSGVDDSYLCTVLPLHGSVVYTPVPMAAYRMFSAAQSANRVKSFGLWVNVFELLEERYCGQSDRSLCKAFHLAFAAKRRRYGKLLMGAGRIADARRQFLKAAQTSPNPASVSKSLVLLALTFPPAFLQPSWPSSDRASGDTMMNYNQKRRLQSLGH